MGVKTEPILFSDGRRGTQTRYQDDEGNWVLSSVVVTQGPDGSPCEHVYSSRAYYRDGVYAFADLGKVTWQIDPARAGSEGGT